MRHIPRAVIKILIIYLLTPRDNSLIFKQLNIWWMSVLSDKATHVAVSKVTLCGIILHLHHVH